MSRISENIKNMALLTDERTIEYDLGMKLNHILEAHCCSDEEMCNRIVDKAYNEGKINFITSKYADIDDGKKKYIVKAAAVNFMNQFAEEISAWYDGQQTPSNLENRDNMFIAEFKHPSIIGSSCQFNPKHGVFSIKETDKYRIAITKTKDKIYSNGIICSSLYPVKSDDKEKLHYYIKMEDVAKKFNYSPMKTLYFITRYKHPQMDIIKSQDNISGEEEMIVFRRLTKTKKMKIIFKEDESAPKAYIRDINGGRFTPVNIESQEFKEKYPLTVKFIDETSRNITLIKHGKIADVFQDRDLDIIEKTNKLVSIYKNFNQSQNKNIKSPNLTKKISL